MSNHNICFCGEIRKIFTGYPPLSRPMHKYIHVVMTNGFALNHDKSLQIYFFWVKRKVKNYFLKVVESTVVEMLKET